MKDKLLKIYRDMFVLKILGNEIDMEMFKMWQPENFEIVMEDISSANVAPISRALAETCLRKLKERQNGE
jgi:hypothetical protein